MSEFLTSAAVAHAQEILADQREFVLDEQAWNEFIRLLDEPARPDPLLVDLFARPRRFTY